MQMNINSRSSHHVVSKSIEYEAALYVDTYLYAIVSPSKVVRDNGCLYFAAMHVEYQNENIAFEKELLVWNDPKAFYHVFEEQGMFQMG